jgi:hypothetical protein
MLQDNVSNGVKACQQLKIQHFGCIGHFIHLVLGPFFIERPKEMAGTNDSSCSDVVVMTLRKFMLRMTMMITMLLCMMI